MEQQNKKNIQFRLNLLDSIVLVVALALGGYVVWQGLSVEETVTTTSAQSIRYTILMNEMRGETGDLVVPGGDVIDVVKNYHLGTVISTQVVPAVKDVLNHDTKSYETKEVEGFSDVYVVMESKSVTATDNYILLDGGYELRVGENVFMRGAGYMAAGEIYAIERMEGD